MVYAIASTRGDPVGVGLLDEVPDGVPSDVIPVHDDSDSEGWRIHGEGRLEYSRELGAVAPRKTACFVRAREEHTGRFFVTPSIEAVRRRGVTNPA